VLATRKPVIEANKRNTAAGKPIHRCHRRHHAHIQHTRAPGIRLIAGFHDEALAGKWKGSRSSRLGDQWRVIYRVVPEHLTYYIESVTPHDYRRP
jgi:mRNA-degrading endonuclease YafQ of YafQ-DinJ toxin-antitoxin module